MSTDTVSSPVPETTTIQESAPVVTPLAQTCCQAHSAGGLNYDRCTATLGHNLAVGDPRAYVNDTQPVQGDDPLAETPPGAALRVSNPYFLSGLCGATCEVQWHKTKEVWELIRVAKCPCSGIPHLFFGRID